MPTAKSKDKLKQQRIDRLAKAREKRLASLGPPKNIHPDVFALPDDHRLSLKNVRSWIKNNKEKIPQLKAAVRQNVKGSLAELKYVEGYIRNCEWYLRNGDWIDNFYGMEQEKRVTWRTLVPAYDKDGNQKTSWETDREVQTTK